MPALLVVLACLLFLYGPVFRDLASVWLTRDNYSHGFLILPVTVLLIWHRRAALHSLSVGRGSAGGLLLVMIAGALLAVGEAGSLLAIRGLSVVVMAAGVTLAFWGSARFRVVAFPVLYLIFMVPIFDEILAPLHWPLQLLTADMAAKGLQLIGATAFVERQYIVLPGVTLEVARVCSGVNYLVSLVAVALPIAYLALRVWWHRVLLVLWALGVGVVANWARVMLIGLWASFGADVLHGPAEVFRAMFVAWVGAAAVAAGAWGLVVRERVLGANPAAPSASQPSLGPERETAGWSGYGRLTSLVLVGLVALQLAYPRAAVGVREDFAAFPVSLGPWQAEPVDIRDAIFRLNGAPYELWRTYRRRQDARPVYVYVALARYQRQGEEILDYRSARLHARATEVEVRIAPDRVASVNRAQLLHEGTEYEAFFWYVVSGRIIADRYQARLATLRKGLAGGRTGVALVVVACERGRNAEAALAKTVAFLPALVPEMSPYLP